MALPVITVIGNLKRTELKYTANGKALFKFQVECSEKNSKGEWDNLYISGELWYKQAEFANQYFKDGSPVIVNGKLTTNSYEKQDGTKAYENKLMFPNISFIPKDKSDSQGQQQDNSYNGNYNQAPGNNSQNMGNANQNIQNQHQGQNDYKIPDIDISSEIPF